MALSILFPLFNPLSIWFMALKVIQILLFWISFWLYESRMLVTSFIKQILSTLVVYYKLLDPNQLAPQIWPNQLEFKWQFANLNIELFCPCLFGHVWVTVHKVSSQSHLYIVYFIWIWHWWAGITTNLFKNSKKMTAMRLRHELFLVKYCVPLPLKPLSLSLIVFCIILLNQVNICF